MQTYEIILLLKNLLLRVNQDPNNGTVISSMEIEALEGAIQSLESTNVSTKYIRSNKTTESKNETSSCDEHASLSPSIKTATKSVILNLKSLDFSEPESPGAILCLDFGTAMSKAWAATEDEDMLDLALGRLAGKGVYPIDSSLFITQDGTLYFGPQAIDQSLKVGSHRQRFDSPKSRLNLGSQGHIDEHLVDKSVNPTGTDISEGDLIRLYLAYLTDLAGTALEEKGYSRYTIRRFARPCWDEDREKWAEPLQKSLLAQAQILADTFHGRWADGISIDAAKEAVSLVRELELDRHLPMHLIDRGIPEPVASAASLMIRDEPQRKLFMVIDVGAGTTDYGLFLMIENPKKDVCKVSIIPGTIQNLPQAGNTLDSHLLHYILRSHDIDHNDHAEGKHIADILRIHIRHHKETLFRDSVLQYTLSNQVNGSITLSDFLETRQVNAFQQQIEDKFTSILRHLNPGWWGLLTEQQRGRLPVVLSGGGASLPMVTRLAHGRFSINGITIICESMPLAPEWTERHEGLPSIYPQLAVAIGGANPWLPEEGQSFNDFAG